jgi:hypothetical protein
MRSPDRMETDREESGGLSTNGSGLTPVAALKALGGTLPKRIPKSNLALSLEDA